MRRVRFLFLIWFCVYIWSFASFAILEPTGDSFTRGLNRVGTFVGSQFGAALLAFAIAVLGRRVARTRAERWILRLPLILAAVFALLLIGIIGYAILGPEQNVTLPMHGNVTAPGIPK